MNKERLIGGKQLIQEGKLQPVFRYDKMIREIVYVEAPVDTDGDGNRDLIKVWIKRPAETDFRIPALLQISPYVGGIAHADEYGKMCFENTTTVPPGEVTPEEDGREKLCQFISGYDETKVPAPRRAVRQAGPEDIETYGDGFENGAMYLTSGENFDYWTVRGIASVNAGVLGTRGSEGFLGCGGEEEVLAYCAVIDWLCGRAPAYTNPTDNIEVRADWCSGDIAMSGQSYKGTTPIATAMTGIVGLRTIVPIAGISSWYHWNRANGAVCGALPFPGEEPSVLAYTCTSRDIPESLKGNFERHIAAIAEAQDIATGDYNSFWEERNYLKDTSSLRASVYIIQGLNDFNVKPGQAINLYEACRRENVPVRMLLHQGEHITPYNISGLDFYEHMNLWYTHFLYGVDNGVLERIPPVRVQSNLDQYRILEQECWPADSTCLMILYPDADGTLGKAPGTGHACFTSELEITGFQKAPDMGAFADCWREALLGEPSEEAARIRARYLSAPLDRDTRLSGRARIEVTASADQTTGNLSAMLVEYGLTEHIALSGMKLVNGRVSMKKNTRVAERRGIVFGGGCPEQDLLEFVTEETDTRIVTRGWMDIQNRVSCTRADSINPGEKYTFAFDMEPTDYTFAAGSQIGLILYADDAEATAWREKVTTYTVDLAETRVILPIEAYNESKGNLQNEIRSCN